MARVIAAEEGRKSHPYVCSGGKITIGVGRNLSDNGLSDGEIELLFANDLRVALAAAEDACPSFAELKPARQLVLTSMAFQLGGRGLGGFKGMLRAVASQDWQSTAAEMLDSLWARQTPARAKRAAEAMHSGVIQP